MTAIGIIQHMLTMQTFSVSAVNMSKQIEEQKVIYFCITELPFFFKFFLF